MYLVDLVKRHGSHHFVNVKYGYLVLLLSVIYLIFRTVSLSYYDKSWRKSGRSTTKLGLVNTPVGYLAAFITAITLIIEFFNLHLDDLTIHIKRFGRIAYALTPLDLYLALRPSPFNLDNYLDTLKLHKWVSRIILVLGILHSFGFMAKWIDLGTFGKIWSPVNLLGLIMFILFDVLLVINWKSIRSSAYQYFYVIHNVTLWSFILLTGLHARPGVGLILVLNLLILLYQFFVRVLNTRNFTTGDVITNDGSKLNIVKIPKSLLPEDYLPGCHLRIGYSVKNPLFWLLPSHPYTVATTYEERGSQANLIVKSTRFSVKPFQTYSIQPFFKSSFPLNFFQTAENVSIVCGGSGISLGVGLFSYFKDKIVNSGKDIKLVLVWITPNAQDLFILKQMQVTGVEVFVTGENFSQLSDESFQEVRLQDSNDEYDVNNTGTVEAIELETLDDDFHALEEQNAESGDLIGDTFALQKNKVNYGQRPDLSWVLARNLNRTIDYANKWIVSCGPHSLNWDCKQLAESSRCRFASEEYAM